MRQTRRTRPAAFVLAALFATTALASDPSVACSMAPPDYVDIEPRPASGGEGVPPAPALRLEGVRRGNGTRPLTSCSDIGVLSFGMPDDATAAASIVVFEVLSSSVETSIVDERPMRPGPPIDGRRYFVFSWIDDAEDAQEPLRMRIRATSLSESGARGGSVTLEVDDPGR
ncbi:MAG TPA: hypothetical protein VFL14_10935 [Xanthomonadales bacterium]|nr:hypothetical protein [Xanthomonadales bacterium]